MSGSAAEPDARPASGSRVSVGRHALLYAVAGLLGKAVAFLMLPVYTRFLTPTDYGVAALIEMTLDVIAIVAGAQIAQGVFRFYHKAESEAERRAVVSTTFAALVVSFGVLGAAVYLVAAPISRLVFGSPENAGLVRLAALNLATQSLIIVPMAFGRVRERSVLIVTATTVKLVIALALNLLLIAGMGMGVRGIFVSTLASNVVIGAWLGGWTLREVGFAIRPDLLRSLVRYGAPLMAVQGATFLMTFADRYFLQAAGDEAMVGLYNLAYQFGFLLLMVGFVPIEMIWAPRRFEVARRADPGPALATAFRLINVSVVTVGVGISLFVGDVLRLMSTPPFHPAATVVPVILIAYLFHGWAMMQDIGVLVRERTEFLTLANWSAAFVALAAFSLLIPRYFALGAAVSSVLAFSVRWGMTYHFSQRLWPIRYDWAPVGRLLAAAVGVCLVAVLLPELPAAVEFSAHLGLLLLYAGLVWTLPILRAEERRAAIRFLHGLPRRSGRPGAADQEPVG